MCVKTATLYESTQKCPHFRRSKIPCIQCNVDRVQKISLMLSATWHSSLEYLTKLESCRRALAFKGVWRSLQFLHNWTMHTKPKNGANRPESKTVHKFSPCGGTWGEVCCLRLPCFKCSSDPVIVTWQHNSNTTASNTSIAVSTVKLKRSTMPR